MRAVKSLVAGGAAVDVQDNVSKLQCNAAAYALPSSNLAGLPVSSTHDLDHICHCSSGLDVKVENLGVIFSSPAIHVHAWLMQHRY